MFKLNMFRPGDKGEQTRELIRETALRLFREKTFDATTMRDIAAAAGLSLGAAYYYYDSKEAIVAAYYDYVQAEHLRRAREAFATTHRLQDRITAAIHSKLDIIAGDRKLLAALFRYGGDPDHPLNWFGPQTKLQRDLSILVFAEAVQHEKFPDDLKKHAPLLLWAMHMGILLYLVYDESPGQKKTRRLADGALGLTIGFRRLITLPLLRPFRKQVFALLDEAGLLPDFAMSEVQSKLKEAVTA